MQLKPQIIQQEHFAVDLETLDTKETAVVLSIGLTKVKYCEDTGTFEVESIYYKNLTPTVFEQVLVGRTIDSDTIAWWRRPSNRRAGEALVSEISSLATSVKRAADWLQDVVSENSYIWGYGAGFDCNILASLFADTTAAPLLKFRNHVCLRTVTSLFDIDFPERTGLLHHAGDDSRVQGLWLKKFLNNVLELGNV